MTEEKPSAVTASDLRKVLALNSKINSTLNIDELLTLIMATAAEVVRAEVSSLLLFDEAREYLIFKVALGDKGTALTEKFRVKTGEGIAGYVAQSGEAVIVNDTQNDPRFAQRFDQQTGFISKAILCVPLTAKGKITGVLEAINPIGRKEFSPPDLDLFQTFADQAAIAVENARLHTEILKQEKAKQELAIAREIQQNFLPDLTTSRFPFDIAAHNTPARDVSGDFYDVLQLTDDLTGILIADVSGKGVPAALFMVNAISNYRFLAPRITEPDRLLFELNNLLVKSSSRGMFMTMLYLVMDRKRRILRYSSAGHHPVMMRAAGAEIYELKNAGGLPVGLAENADYSFGEHPLQKDDLFFLYTDGISEARNNRSEEYSIIRLKECLKTRQATASDYVKAVIRDLGVFTEGADQHDDMTMLAATIPE
jgi:sigma-B regulation protein RsbU (phosphoserine phosphatase)